MQRSHVLVLGLLVLVLCAVGYYAYNVRQKVDAGAPAAVALAPADAAAYTDLNGQPVALEKEFGNVLIVVSWASWCPDCAPLLKEIDALAGKYPEVSALAINRAEPQTTALRYLNAVVGETRSIKLVMDESDHYYKTINAYAMPEVLIYDTEGEIAERFRGVPKKESLESRIQSLLDTNNN